MLGVRGIIIIIENLVVLTTRQHYKFFFFLIYNIFGSVVGRRKVMKWRSVDCLFGINYLIFFFSIPINYRQQIWRRS